MWNCFWPEMCQALFWEKQEVACQLCGAGAAVAPSGCCVSEHFCVLSTNTSSGLQSFYLLLLITVLICSLMIEAAVWNWKNLEKFSPCYESHCNFKLHLLELIKILAEDEGCFLAISGTDDCVMCPCLSAERTERRLLLSRIWKCEKELFISMFITLSLDRRQMKACEA